MGRDAPFTAADFANLYDFSLAISGIIACGSDNLDDPNERNASYWEPLRDEFRRMTAVPGRIQCFTHQTGKEEARVFLILPPNRVVWIGDALTARAARFDWRERKRSAYEKNDAEALRQIDEEGPHRTFWDGILGVYLLPLPSQTFTREGLEQAIRQFFCLAAPHLETVPLEWVPEDTAVDLAEAIEEEVFRERSARHGTEPEDDVEDGLSFTE